MTGAAVEARAFAAMDRRLDARSAAPLVVAASGGGDSTALLELAVQWGRRLGRPVMALHVDHGLNPGSAEWRGLVAAHAARLHAAFVGAEWAGPKPATGLPAAARTARHGLLAEAARAAGARVILMGHTADDVLEGESMRAEGSSLGRVREWGPSPAWPEGREVMLLRPLLGVRRAELRTWLEGQGVPWIEDPANADLRFARTRVRQTLREEPTQAVPAPSRAGLVDLVQAGPGGILAIKRGAFGELAPGEAHPLISAALLCAGGGTRPPRGDALERLTARLAAAEPVHGTLAGARVTADDLVIRLGRDPARAGPPNARAEPGRAVVWDGRIELEPERAGVIMPLAGWSKRLPSAERAAVAAVPAVFRPTLPVLHAGGEVRLLRGRWLALPRLRATLGGVAREADLDQG